MVNKMIWYLVIAGAVGLLVLSTWDSLYGGLRIEKIEPDKLTLEQFGDAEINLTFVNHGDSDIENYEIRTSVKHSSGKYLQTNNATFTEKIGKDGGTQQVTMKPVRVLQKEGSELSYSVTLDLYTNGDFEKEYKLPVTIVNTSPSFPIYKKSNDNELIVFSGLNTGTINLFEGEETTIDFRVKMEKSGSFDKIRIEPFLENHRGQFLEIESHIEDEKLDVIAEETGKISIHIKALKSEGEKIKYRLQLVLFNDQEQMDSEIIDVVID